MSIAGIAAAYRFSKIIKVGKDSENEGKLIQDNSELRNSGEFNGVIN